MKHLSMIQSKQSNEAIKLDLETTTNTLIKSNERIESLEREVLERKNSNETETTKIELEAANN